MTDTPTSPAAADTTVTLPEAQANRVAIAEREIERVIREHHYHPDTRTCECGTRVSTTGGIYFARRLAIEIADAQEAKR